MMVKFFSRKQEETPHENPRQDTGWRGRRTCAICETVQETVVTRVSARDCLTHYHEEQPEGWIGVMVGRFSGLLCPACQERADRTLSSMKNAPATAPAEK